MARRSTSKSRNRVSSEGGQSALGKHVAYIGAAARTITARSPHAVLGELIPVNKGDARLVLIGCFVVAYVVLVYGIYRVQQYESYTALYVSTPLLFVAVWLIILAATRNFPTGS